MRKVKSVYREFYRAKQLGTTKQNIQEMSHEKK